MVEGTLQEAVELLAKRASYRRIVPPSVADREKVAVSDYLSSLGTQLKENPVLAQALIGTAAGAGIGGIGTMVNNAGRKKRDRKSVFNNALTGALAGAGLGAGLGAARSGLSGLGSSQGLAGGRDMRPGSFSMNGQQLQINPEALRQNPALLNRVKELTAPKSLPEQVVGRAVAGLNTLREAVPWTGTAAMIAAPIDVLLHNRLFGINRINAEQATGPIAQDILRKGVTDTNLGKALPVPLQEGITGGITGGDISVRGAAPGKPTSVMDALLSRSARNAGPADTVLIVRSPITEKLVQETPGVPPSANSPGTPGYTRETQQTVGTHVDRLTGNQRTQLMRAGREAADHLKDVQLYRDRIFGKTYTGAKSLGGAIGARAALYGLPMLAEYGVGSLLDDYAQQRSMQDIIRSLRAQGHIREVPAGGGR